MAVSPAWIGGVSRRSNSGMTSAASTTTPMPSVRPSASENHLERRVGLFGAREFAAMAPTSVSIPVAVTTTAPDPRVTFVPFVGHRLALGQRRVGGDRIGGLRDRGALAGKRRIVYLEELTSTMRPSAGTTSPQSVRRRRPGRGPSRRRRPTGRRAGPSPSARSALPQRFEALLGAVVLDEAEQPVGDDDDGDEHRVDGVASPTWRGRPRPPAPR